MNTILVTGSAGFIGSSLVLKLLKRGDLVVGLDNHNDYYDPSLKEARLSNLIQNKNYTHIRADLQDKETIEEVFNKYMPDYVVNLAAQAGVRYSIENPGAYIGSNIVGFNNILECCRHHSVKHLVYASSSSVYGANETVPFSVRDNVDHPISLYAATKKSNELTAHAYSNLFNLPTTGLRFFTVYGPWGRPDMALFKFTKAILENKKIQVYNYGNHHRDFTYIDDIVKGIMKVLDSPATSNKNWSGLNPDPGSSKAPWKVYNIGNNNPVKLLDFIKVIERFLGKEVQKELLPMQPGDVADTYADVQNLVDEFNFQPSTSIEEGIEKFITWYKDFYRV
jgi:UDP-glucuronate 4-epimerase